MRSFPISPVLNYWEKRSGTTRRISQRIAPPQNCLRGPARRKIAAGKILLDSTSGNTGIAYACSAALGFPVTPLRARECVRRNEKAFYRLTARISSIPIRVKARMRDQECKYCLRARPRSYFICDQYSNDANWRAHYLTTANEIWRQTEGPHHHFVAMLGTTGTFVGTTRRLEGIESAGALHLAAPIPRSTH